MADFGSSSGLNDLRIDSGDGGGYILPQGPSDNT